MHIHHFVVNDPSESISANEEYNYDVMDTHIYLNTNSIYYMTKDERLMSSTSRMGLMCAEDPNRELERLVWDLFYKVSDVELSALARSYHRVMAEEIGPAYWTATDPYDFFPSS